MRIMIASDIHGSALYCKQMLDRYENENCERLVLLGDLLYHGPRNDLPAEYAPKKVIELLNNKKEEILAVRGNCEAEVDQMVLDFPVLADYAILYDGGCLFFLTHGHNYNLEKLPPLKQGDVLVHGHTHIPAMKVEKGIHYINPGSVSIPKEQSAHSYMIYEDSIFTLKDLDGNVIKSYQI